MDGGPENNSNIDRIFEKLDVEHLEYEESMYSGDQKFGNLLFKVGSHGSMCPCLYCTASKIHDDTGQRTTEKAEEWSEGLMRTAEQVAGLWNRFLAKWRGREHTDRARADLKNFFSVQGIPANVPRFMWTRLILLCFPPDALHVTLLGR